MNNRTVLVAFVIAGLTLIAILRVTANNHRSQARSVSGERADHQGNLRQDSVANTFRARMEAHSGSSTTPQGVEGFVVDRRGNPVIGAEVVAMFSDEQADVGALMKSITDKEGRFSIKGMRAGTYDVYVQTPGGPVCPSCLFYSGGSLPDTVTKVTVLDGQMLSNVVLKAPPKPAKVTGRVSDNETNEPVAGARITLRRVDNPSYYLETGTDEKGKFGVPLPLVPVTMEVASPGYRRWSYVKDGVPRDGANSLKLNPGESRKLEVRLRKSNP